ncbi:MAG: 23S rRNA (guanosine2251-2'-O)-methyltransferase [Myxococcota bacterium]|jgi:23S rRNA (guanosine2251-2'-O)-methyltransferase
MTLDQLEGRNPVLECLQRGKRRVHRVLLDRGAKPDVRVRKIIELASQCGAPVERVARQKLDQVASGRVHNGVIAMADPLQNWTARALLDDILRREDEPFVVLADALAYEHNLGAVLRSCLAFGVHGLFLPSRRGAGLSPVVQRVAMGAAEVIPVARESLFTPLKALKKAGVSIMGADMDGGPCDQARMSGPLALVLGAEGRGLSPTLRARCDSVVSVPLAGQLESLNVSVAGGILMYEKRRQDGWKATSGG